MSGKHAVSAKGAFRDTWAMHADGLVLSALAGLWIGLVLLVDPRGDFPILDDWSYGRSVKTLIEQGRLQYDGWNAPTLFLQVLYGALFCLPFGFSFEALRISTLVAGLAGGLGTYLLLREASATRLAAVVGSLVVLLNPSYFQHAFTFMTDVPFTALAVISALFFLRALRTYTTRDVVLATVVASCATLIRQPGIVIPVGYGLALVARSTFEKRLLLRAGLPAMVTFAVYAVYDRAIDYLQLKPVLLGTFLDLPLMRLKTQGALPVILDSIRRGEALFAHMSLFVLPCLLVLLGYALRQNPLTPTLRRVLLGVSPALFLFVYWRFWPPALSLQVFGMVPLVMVGVMEGGRNWGLSGEHFAFRPVVWSGEFIATTLMICVSIAAVVRIVRRPEPDCRFDCASALFGLSTSVMLLAPFIVAPFFERYLIPVLPFVLLTLVALAKPTQRTESRGWYSPLTAGGILALIGFSAVSISYAHDHMVWNRLRWQAVNFLVREKGIDPSTIDGGLSVNGWHLFPLDGPVRKRYANWHFERGNWWRNEVAEYIVAISNPTRLDSLIAGAQGLPSERLDVVWKKSFTGWLPGADGDVLVCRGPLCRKIFDAGR